jgi:Xaa-Pro aminopeptidase
MTSTLLMYGAPGDCPDMFHEIPTGIIDPFLYIETNGRRGATVTLLDAHKVAPFGVEIIDPFELGADELLESGISRHDVELELTLRAAQRYGVTRALVPNEFPVGVADHLRAAGIELVVEPEAFVNKRRVKTAAEIAGIRRAQAAADAAMAVGARMIHELRDGVTSEEVRAAMQAVCDERGCDLPDDVIVSHGPQGAIGHEAGHGEIAAGEPVIVDIWPRDRASRCWADMTRTFIAGGAEPPPEIAAWWKLTRESLERSFAAVRAGADGREIYGLSCEPFEAAGQLTQRNKVKGEKLDEGYYHSLGHGVGLEVHERPNLGRTPDALVAGDVITLEPGCYRKDIGGVRLEDLVLVTDGGAELLTNFPYELQATNT